MTIKRNEIARGVRVKLNSNFIPKCLGDEYLQCEEVIFIAEEKPYNDQKGDYVFLRGGSGINSGYAYLDQLDLEFPYSDNVRHPVYYRNDIRPMKKEFIGFTRFFDGGVPVFFGDGGGSEFRFILKDQKEAWEIYSKRLKITIEEITSLEKD